jgi:hypothetical protein
VRAPQPLSRREPDAEAVQILTRRVIELGEERY